MESRIQDCLGFHYMGRSCIKRFQSRFQHRRKFIETKEHFYIIRLNSHRIDLVHQHGRQFIVLEPNMVDVKSCEDAIQSNGLDDAWAGIDAGQGTLGSGGFRGGARGPGGPSPPPLYFQTNLRPEGPNKCILETRPIFINAKEKIIQLYFESCSKTLSIICANAGGTPQSSPMLSALPKPMNFSQI